MPRVKRSLNAKKKRRRILKAAKGYRGANSKLYKIATEAVERGLCYAYRDRRVRKREMRALWITRINAAARMNDITYSRLMEGLKKANVALDRKSLSEIAATDPKGFSQIASIAKSCLAA